LIRDIYTENSEIVLGDKKKERLKFSKKPWGKAYRLFKVSFLLEEKEI
jgi:hypothetical protein